MFPLHELAIVPLPLALASNWWLVIWGTLAVLFILLSLALLWLAARQLQTTPDGRDVGEDGLLGLTASDPLAPPASAALNRARAETPAARMAVSAGALPERGLPVEVRPRVTAEDLSALTAVAEAPPAAPKPAEMRPPATEADPWGGRQADAPRKSPLPDEPPPLPAPATALLSTAPTLALPASPPQTSPLAQDIRDRLAQAPSPAAREGGGALAAPAERMDAAPADGDALAKAQQTQAGEWREARLTERLPASRKALRPPQPPVAAPLPAPPPVSLPAAEAAPPKPLPVQFVPQVAPPPRPAAEFAPPLFVAEERPTGIGREAAWLVVLFALFCAVLGSLSIIFLPAARNRVLPPAWAERVAAIPRALGLEAAPPPIPVKQVEVRRYANAYSAIPKGATGKIVRAVTIAGLVKNISSEKLFDLRAEIELYPREPEGAPPERRIIYLTPNLLEPQQEGRYTLTVADAEYRQCSLKRVVTGDGKDLKEVPAVFVPGTLEPPEEAPAKTAPPRRR